MRIVAPTVLFLALVGCVSAYQEPPGSTDDATIVYSRSDSVPRWGHTQLLQIVGDERCSSRNRVKDFVPLGAQEPHAFRVQAQGRKYFMLETVQTTGGAHGFTDTSCSNVVSFEPKPGRSYGLVQHRGAGRCFVEVTDAATGAAEPTLTVHPFERTCVSVW